MASRELFHDPFDGRSDPVQRATFDTGKGFFLVQHTLAQRRLGQVEARREGDGILGADIGAEAALQAGVLLKPQLRQVGIVAKRAGGAERDAGQAQGAGIRIDQNCAIWRPIWQWQWLWLAAKRMKP